MDHTIALIEKAHAGDEGAREQLVEENVGLIWCVAKRFYGRGVEAEDLFQIGSIGLLKAIDKFDFSYMVKFSTYAVPMIAGEIRRFLREDGMIKVSRSLKELAYKAYILKEKMTDEFGREPTLDEIANQMGVVQEELVQAMEACVDVESIHKPEGELSVLDWYAGEENPEEKVLDRLLLGQLLNHLETKERQLIYLRYFANQTQMQVGRQLGISQVQVSRIEKKILKRLREYAYNRA